MIPEVVQTFKDLTELHIRKNQDYTGGRIDPFYNFNVAEYISSQFAEDRDRVYATLVGIKLARLAALLGNPQKINFESISDTFDDLIVYSAIWKAAVERDGHKLLSKVNPVSQP